MEKLNKNALPNWFCNELIKYGNQRKESMGIVGEFKNKEINNKNIKKLKQVRDSNIVWLTDKWIYRMILPFVHDANKSAGWNYDIDAAESCQFTKYKLNQYYNWHCDDFNTPYDCPNDLSQHGKIRKLSVTCSLSSPDDYKGGELEFDFRNSVK